MRLINPQELTQVSDWGSGVQPTPLRFERRRVSRVFGSKKLCSEILARRESTSGRRRACWWACLTTIPTSST
ncbi:hypothetical protein DMW52_06610 [Serratia marcescens]|nr:hypothetical protein DMW52_06610 [Serratia marcescens]